MNKSPFGCVTGNARRAKLPAISEDGDVPRRDAAIFSQRPAVHHAGMARRTPDANKTAARSIWPRGYISISQRDVGIA
jgi:hypothetical protein